MGRYSQPDPLGMPDGPAIQSCSGPAGQPPWAYARSAPTMYVDPTGLVVQLPATVAAGTARALAFARRVMLAQRIARGAQMYVPPGADYCVGDFTPRGPAYDIVDYSPVPAVDDGGPDLPRIASDIEEWLGEGYRYHPSPSGARQFISADNDRVVRFDLEEAQYLEGQRHTLIWKTDHSREVTRTAIDI